MLSKQLTTWHWKSILRLMILRPNFLTWSSSTATPWMKINEFMEPITSCTVFQELWCLMIGLVCSMMNNKMLSRYMITQSTTFCLAAQSKVNLKCTSSNICRYQSIWRSNTKIKARLKVTSGSSRDSENIWNRHTLKSLTVVQFHFGSQSQASSGIWKRSPKLAELAVKSRSCCLIKRKTVLQLALSKVFCFEVSMSSTNYRITWTKHPKVSLALYRYCQVPFQLLDGNSSKVNR